MKKIFIISAIALLFSTVAKAQSSVVSLRNVDYPTFTVDTVTNTGSGAVYINLTQGYSNLTIQPKVTKISGTMNSASKPQLYGSIDGTNYYAITGDTLHITNTSSAIVTNWVLTSQDYKYYKISWTGSGTMSAKLEGSVLLVK